MTLTDHSPADLADAPATATSVDEESVVDFDASAAADQRFAELVERLSRQSVDKHFAAYEDIPWDDPEYAIDPKDPRWAQVDEALRATDWYQSLPAETQSELGLYHVASLMKIGLQFESVLKRGLLEFAFKLPNNDPMFRYVYHEVIEEGQHSLMFQEFVNRAGFDSPGMPGYVERITHRIVALGRWFPELFFMFVLGGEDPIDYTQREALRGKNDLTPIVERIMRIHVTEEARHLSFARHYLKRRANDLSFVRRQALGIGTPLILGVMAQMMMRPSPSMVKRYDIPRSVLRDAYTKNPAHQEKTVASLRKVRRLSRELGIVNPVNKLLWKGLGIWSED